MLQSSAHCYGITVEVYFVFGVGLTIVMFRIKISAGGFSVGQGLRSAIVGSFLIERGTGNPSPVSQKGVFIVPSSGFKRGSYYHRHASAWKHKMILDQRLLHALAQPLLTRLLVRKCLPYCHPPLIVTHLAIGPGSVHTHPRSKIPLPHLLLITPPVIRPCLFALDTN